MYSYLPNLLGLGTIWVEGGERYSFCSHVRRISLRFWVYLRWLGDSEA